MVFRKDPCGFFCILMTYGKTIVHYIWVMSSMYFTQSSLIIKRSSVHHASASYAKVSISFQGLFCTQIMQLFGGQFFKLWQVDSVCQKKLEIKKQKDQTQIPIFQGDSLWGSLHVLLFNTVSEDISESSRNKNFVIQLESSIYVIHAHR